MSAQIEAWLHRTWSHRGLVPILLSPLSLVFRAVSEWKRRKSVAKSVPVPVVVVGNIYVGGTGKTPVTIALVRALREKGWTPELYFEQKAAYEAEKAEHKTHGR